MFRKELKNWMRSRGVLRLLRGSYFVLTQPDRFATGASRSLFDKPLERPNTLPAVAAAVVRDVETRTKVEAPRVVAARA